MPGDRLGMTTEKVEPSTVRLTWYRLSFPRHQIYSGIKIYHIQPWSSAISPLISVKHFTLNKPIISRQATHLLLKHHLISSATRGLYIAVYLMASYTSTTYTTLYSTLCGLTAVMSSCYLVLLDHSVLLLLWRRLPGDQDGCPVGVALGDGNSTWGATRSCDDEEGNIWLKLMFTNLFFLFHLALVSRLLHQMDHHALRYKSVIFFLPNEYCHACRGVTKTFRAHFFHGVSFF